MKDHKLKPGGYLLRDNRGFFINDANLSNITGPWLDLVKELKIGVANLFMSQNIYGMYVRGAVARGHAIEAFSDIDIVILLISLDKAHILSWENSMIEETILKKFTIATRVDATIEAITQGVSDETKFLLKTQGICVYGKDIIPYLPEYHLTALAPIYLPIFQGNWQRQ